MNIQNKYEAALNILAKNAVKNKYKLVYEKNGELYGSETGIPSEHDFCITAEPVCDKIQVMSATDSPITTAKPEPVVEEPAAELPIVQKSTTGTRSKRKLRAAAVEPVVKTEPEVI